MAVEGPKKVRYLVDEYVMPNGAKVYLNRQDFAKCKEENEMVLSFDPQNQMALYNLGAIAATQGKIAEAKEYWNKVVSIDSESETANLAKESLSKL